MQKNTAIKVYHLRGRKLTGELQVGQGEGGQSQEPHTESGDAQCNSVLCCWYPETVMGNRASHPRRYLKGSGSVSTVTLS